MSRYAHHREVLVVGWRGSLPPCPYSAPRVIPIDSICAFVGGPRSGTVLVLGDDALHDLDPGAVSRLVRFPACVALAVPRAVSVELVARWARCPEVAVVDPDRLDVRLREAVGIPPRIPVPEKAWLPFAARPGSPADRIASCLPTLPALTVELWAQRLGIERHALQRVCAESFRCTPTELRWLYVLAVTRAERARGWTVAQVASSLGLDDAKSLTRLFRLRGRSVPARGADSRPFPMATSGAKAPPARAIRRS